MFAAVLGLLMGVLGSGAGLQPPAAAPGPVHLQVTFNITCLSADDGLGDQEELYGEVFLRLNGHHHTLWEASSEQAVKLAKDSVLDAGSVVVNTSMIFINGEDKVSFKELVIGAQLRERDGAFSADDVLGSAQVDYSDGRGQLKFFPAKLIFRNDGTVMQLEITELQFGLGHKQ